MKAFKFTTDSSKRKDTDIIIVRKDLETAMKMFKILNVRGYKYEGETEKKANLCLDGVVEPEKTMYPKRNEYKKDRKRKF